MQRAPHRLASLLAATLLWACAQGPATHEPTPLGSEPQSLPSPRRLPPGHQESLAKGVWADLQDARLFVPDGLVAAADARIPVCIHFQGAPIAAAENFVRSRRDGCLIASTIRGLSSAFAGPYRDPEAFGRLLAEGEQELARILGRPARFGDLAVSSWSAGYGAVRELLKDPRWFERIGTIAVADSIYATVVAQDVRAPLVADMVDFGRFAQAAARGEKTMIVAYGLYQTDYASTSETARWLNACVDAEMAAVPDQTARGIPIARQAHVGRYHCYEFAESGPGIHVDCLYFVPEMLWRHGR